jgi:hypothetical protein
LSDCLMANE